MTTIQTIQDLPFDQRIVTAKARNLKFATANHTFNIGDTKIYISTDLNLKPLNRIEGEPQDFAIKTDSKIYLMGIEKGGKPQHLPEDEEQEIIKAISQNIIFDIQYAE